MNVNMSPNRIGFMTMPSGWANSFKVPELGLWTSPTSVTENDSFRMKNKVEITKAIKKIKQANLDDVVPIKSCFSKLSIATTRRRVRFQLDADGVVAKQYERPSRVHYLTPQERKNCWWTKTEMIDIRKRAVVICRYYMSSRLDYHLAAIRMMERCGAERSDIAGEIESAMEFEEVYDESYDMRLIVDGDARGLEKRLFNAMNLPFLRYKSSIENVMSTQSRLLAVDTKTFTKSKKAKLIASQYTTSSQYATIWALKLASADAQTLLDDIPAFI